eukprot:6289032-Pyramimonas_sp.AAC.1
MPSYATPAWTDASEWSEEVAYEDLLKDLIDDPDGGLPLVRVIFHDREEEGHILITEPHHATPPTSPRGPPSDVSYDSFRDCHWPGAEFDPDFDELVDRLDKMPDFLPVKPLPDVHTAAHAASSQRTRARGGA